MSEVCCDDCKFYVSKDDKEGDCHRYPPRLCVYQAIVKWAFPAVDADEWCGEFAALEEEG